MKPARVIAGIPDGHFQRLRETFSVRLLEKGVPLETVTILIGNSVREALRALGEIHASKARRGGEENVDGC